MGRRLIHDCAKVIERFRVLRQQVSSKVQLDGKGYMAPTHSPKN